MGLKYTHTQHTGSSQKSPAWMFGWHPIVLQAKLAENAKTASFEPGGTSSAEITSSAIAACKRTCVVVAFDLFRRQAQGSRTVQCRHHLADVCRSNVRAPPTASVALECYVPHRQVLDRRLPQTCLRFYKPFKNQKLKTKMEMQINIGGRVDRDGCRTPPRPRGGGHWYERCAATTTHRCPRSMLAKHQWSGGAVCY